MAVYIEYVIIDNFVIDFLLAFAVVKTLNIPCKMPFIMLSALIGTAFAVILPLVKLPSFVVMAVKISVAPLICLPLCHNCAKKFLYSLLLMLAYTFAFGGAILGLLLLGGGFDFVSGTVCYSTNFPIGIYLAAAVLLVGVFARIFNYYKAYSVKRKHIISCILSVADTQISLDGYADSGNLLEIDGLPVVFATDKTLLKVLGKSISKAIADGKKVGLTSVSYATLSGEGRATAFPTTISYDGQTRRIMLAMTRKNDICYSLILNARLFGGENEDSHLYKETFRTTTR